MTVVPALNFRSREIGEAGLDWQNGLKLVIWLMVLGISLIKIGTYRHLFRSKTILAFLIFSLLAILSSIYSSVPAYTAACAIGLLSYLLFACFVAARVSERAILLTCSLTLAAYFAVTWLYAAAAPGAAFLPPYGEREIYRLFGLSSHPNMLAMEGACFFALLLPAAFRGYIGHRWVWLLGLLGAATILATGSRTSALAIGVSLAVVWIRAARLMPGLLMAVAVVGAVALLASGLGVLPDIDSALGSVSRTGDANEVLTLTGRTELWSFVWDKFMHKPWLGYGFNSTELVLAKDWYGNADSGVGAHNTLLQSLLTMGCLGTVPLVTGYGLLIHRWAVNPRALTVILVPYLMVVGATEVHIASIPVLLTLLVFLLTAKDAAIQLTERSRTPSQHHSCRGHGYDGG
jgi:O-antigen ligase